MKGKLRVWARKKAVGVAGRRESIARNFVLQSLTKKVKLKALSIEEDRGSG